MGTGRRCILGIDPGSRFTGYGIIESDGVRDRFLACGRIRLSGTLALPVRLHTIFTELAVVMQEYQPQEVAVEQVFLARNAASALKLGQARGAAICAVAQAGVPVFEYSAKAIKQSVVGTGAADKQQVIQMIDRLLQPGRALQPDEADALATALCHAHHQHFQRQLLRRTGT